MIERIFRGKQLARIEHRLGVVHTLLETVTRKICKMAREQDDLNAAVATLTTAVTGAVDEIKTETQNILDALKAQTPTGVDPDAVESAANTINALAAKLNDAVSSAQTALTPAPATTGADAQTA
jgi:division protein CdvB (Snf7/Vps24/ESCRT-III family)